MSKTSKKANVDTTSEAANKPQKTKIAIVTEAFYPHVDGVIRVIDNYARELMNYPEYDVTIVVPGPNDPAEYKKVLGDLPYKIMACKTSWFGYDGYKKPYLDRAFKKKFKDAHFDLIHTHSAYNLYWFLLKVAKKQHIPVILTVHCQFLPDFKRYVKFPPAIFVSRCIIANHLRKCDLMISLSDMMDTYIRREFNYRGKSLIVPNSPSFVPPSPSEIRAIGQETRKKLGVADNVPVFCFLGRLVRAKGVFMILKALKILKDRGMAFKMIYVGSGFDEKELKEEVEKSGFSEDIIMAGQVNEYAKLVEVFAASKLFLFPSTYDVDPLVKREAAACLCPAICLEGQYGSAGIENGVNGFLCQQSPESLADKIVEALADEPLRDKIAMRARETLFSTWKDNIAGVTKIYEAVLAEHKAKQ